MPTPTPRKGESKNNFISRFMKAEKDSTMSQSQKLAAAYKAWEDSKRKKK